jgi:hypothetical protein
MLSYSFLGPPISYQFFFLQLKIVHLFQDLISEVVVSPNSEDDSSNFNDGGDSQLNVVNYDNGKESTFPFL